MSTAEVQDSTPNRPRNFLVTDATKPYTFSYLQYGKPVSIIVHQTADDETWPGGALWDIGVLLSHFLVALAGFQPFGVSKDVKPPERLMQSVPSVKNLTVLELGCGVGLTGIVAATVLGTSLTIVTDLDVVVEKVARRNVETNSTPVAPAMSSGRSQQPYRLTQAGKRGKIMALPLRWGDDQDAEVVMHYFRTWTKAVKPSRKHKSAAPLKDSTQPDLIVIGDVAYQHKPGAPSHFESLLSTVLKFLGDHTLVIFGIRMR